MRLIAVAVVAALAGAALGGIAVYRLRPSTPPLPPVAVTSPPPAETSVLYTAVDIAALPGWSEDAAAQALPGLHSACARLQSMDDAATIGTGALARPAAAWHAACAALATTPDNDATVRATLAQIFTPYRVSIAKGTEVSDAGTFTGYYEAELNGSLTPGGAYQVPIYAPPRDLISANIRSLLPKPVTLPDGVPDVLVGRLDPQTPPSGVRQLRPYYTRQEIDRDHALDGLADVLLWADDPVAVHILHIQGSGRVSLPDGSVVRIGFAGHNGRAFRGLGSILLDAGVLAPGQGSMIAIRDWLKANPDRAADYMNRNARYIFFRRLSDAEAGDGPIGALGMPLTAGRAIAVDQKYIPLGAPVWLDTRDPDGAKLQRLVVAADTGAAITGPIRADYFWGHGEDAFLKAARMKSTGSYFVFVPRAAAPPSNSAS